MKSKCLCWLLWQHSRRWPVVATTKNKTTGGGGNNGTGGDPVESEYKVTFSDTSYYSSVATFEAITENAKSQSFMAVVFETAFLEQQIPGITDNDIAKGVINYYKAEYMSQGATVADIYNVLTQQGRLHGSVTPLELDVPVCPAGYILLGCRCRCQ